MTPADLIGVLKDADAAEIAEIRQLLGVPAPYRQIETMLIGPGPDNYGRGWGDTAARLAELLREAQPPEPEALGARDPVKRETV